MISLTALNMEGMPGQVEGFFGDSITGDQKALADGIAYGLIAIVLALLTWTVVELHHGNKAYVAAQAAKNKQREE